MRIDLSGKTALVTASTGGIGYATAEELAGEFVMAHRPGSVIRRAAGVDEVANMVVYVCSPQASATSGAALRVDGGMVDDIV